MLDKLDAIKERFDEVAKLIVDPEYNFLASSKQQRSLITHFPKLEDRPQRGTCV